MNGENTDWGKSVSGVLIKDGKVLLARHTYGSGNGKLIIPGGYINIGESPEQAIVREYMEETGVLIKPERIIGIRFNVHDWYVCFEVSYVDGTPPPRQRRKQRGYLGGYRRGSCAGGRPRAF